MKLRVTAPNPSSSTSAQNYTPLENITSTPNQPSSAPHIRPVFMNNLNPIVENNPITNRYDPAVTTQDGAHQRKGWILLGVKGAKVALTPVQIVVNYNTSDSSIVKELKNYHQAHRGVLRRWFSLWSMGYCQIVKVYKKRRLHSQFIEAN
jgi:hypothetical protein